MRPLALLAALALFPVYACSGPGSAAPVAHTLRRPAGERAYRFTSTQITPGGTSTVQVDFILKTSENGNESAQVTAYRRSSGAAPLAAALIDSACARRLAAPAGAIAVLPITPPPHDLAQLIPNCVPEDLFGAASDILPLLMIQAQPQYRVAELRKVGERLRFGGYSTGWRLPPTLLDATITADSGIVSLDSSVNSKVFIGWNTSPMRIALVRQLSPNQRALFHGQEWFWAQIVVDQKTGLLLEGRTVVDSLALRMVLPYADSIAPLVMPDAGLPVAISRRLRLDLVDSTDPHGER